MFSKNQVKELAIEGVNEGIRSGQVQVGTKLYKHFVQDTSGDFSISYISTDPEPYPSGQETLANVIEGAIIILTMFNNLTGNGAYAGMTYEPDNEIIFGYDIEDGSWNAVALSLSINIDEDVVTPL